MRRFDLILPRAVDDCVKVLKDRGGEAKLVAGGTDLIPQLKNGLVKPACVVDLSGDAKATTFAPPCANSRADARPMPAEAPVITTVRS